MLSIFGIDPGYTGAIAIYWPEANKLEMHDMPIMLNHAGKNIIDCHALLNILEPATKTRFAVVERVGSMPGQGVSSVFRFGEGYGMLQACIAANKHPMHFVTPAKWKGHFGLNRDKGVSRSKAMERFPEYAQLFSRVKDDGRAEAALIALYGAENFK